MNLYQRIVLLRLILVLCCSSYVCAATEDEEVLAPLTPAQFHEQECQRYARAMERDERGALDWDFSDEFDVKYYHLTVDVRDYVGRTIYANVLINSEIVSASLDSMDLDFCSTLSLDSIVSADYGPVGFVRANHRVAFALGGVYTQGQTVSVRVYYHGTPCQTNGQWSFWYYTRPVGPAQVPAVHALSESMGARDWWPCKDQPEDKADSARVTIICADSLTATSNGLLEASVALPPSSKVVTWVERYPIATYLITLNVTNYRRYDSWYVALNGDSVPINHYVYPERYNQAQASWSPLPAMMQMLAEKFGEYPFAEEKYGHTMCNFPGAMEHQCNTSYGRSLTTGTHFYDYVITHEAAHQWWGDCVTLYSWPDVWLNEGFASYAEALWIEDQYGLDSLRGYQLSPAGNDVVDPSGPVYNPTPLFSGNTVYDKGSWILHMLRGVVRNDSIFYAILREYRNRHEYSVAQTVEFLDAAADVSGLDITSYLYAYLYRTNRPIYSVSFGTGTVDGVAQTVVRVRQTQTDPDTTFHTRLDLSFDDRRAMPTVDNELWNQRYYFNLGFTPATLAVDPDNWVLRTVQYTALPLTILNAALDTAEYGQAYSEQLEAVSGTAPYSWSIVQGVLPGEFLFAPDGRITTDQVTSYGHFAITVRVNDAIGNADTMQFTLHIAPEFPPPVNMTIYSAGDSMVRLRWKTAIDVDSFHVWRATDAAMTDRVLIGSTTELTFTDSLFESHPDSSGISRARFYQITSVLNQ